MDGNQNDQNQNQQGQQANQQQNQNQQGQQSQAAQIDYERIQKMLDGTLAAKEDTALKAYFKQQGLSQQEAESAMAAFKQQKAANTPDVAGMQAQLAQAQKEAQEARVEREATITALGMGIDAKTAPYVLKLADLSQVKKDDGSVDADKVKEALNKVLTDIPQLKPQAGAAGGFKIGSGDNGNNAGQAQEDQLRQIFGIRKNN